MPAQITLPIMGVDFPNKKGPTRRFALELLTRGDPVELRPEPNNPADEHAIAVYSVEGVQMGYVPAGRAGYVGKRMREGQVAAVYQGRGERGDFIRIAFDGEEPVLPPMQEKRAGESDFWPDPIWDDDGSQ